MSRKEWVLTGLHKNWVLIHRRDLRAGEKVARYTGNVAPDVFDPGNPSSISEALLWIRTLTPHLQLPQSAPEQRVYIANQIRGALERGDLVMVSCQADLSEIRFAAPQERGGGIAWPVNVSSNRYWVSRKEHALPGDMVVQAGEMNKIVNGLLERTTSANLPELLELLKDTAARPAKGRPDIRELRSRLQAAFRSGEIVVIREMFTGGGGGSGNSKDAVESDSSADDRAGSPLSAGKSTQTHWIEIRLVGSDGQPVPSEQYRIQLPTGEFAEGNLDNDGRARVDGIPNPGTCQVTFPNLEADAWVRA
jgi:hypothetical protein